MFLFSFHISIFYNTLLLKILYNCFLHLRESIDENSVMLHNIHHYLNMLLFRLRKFTSLIYVFLATYPTSKILHS